MTGCAGLGMVFTMQGPAVITGSLHWTSMLTGFFNSAGLIRMKLPCTKEELKELLRDLVKKMDTGDLFVYFQATRGTAVRAHEFPENVPSNLWVMLKPLPTPDVYKKDPSDHPGGYAVFTLQYQDTESSAKV